MPSQLADAHIADAQALEFCRSQLRGKSGRVFWRALEALADTDAFRTAISREFPSLAPRLPAMARRTLLKAMGASLLMTGLAGCGDDDGAALPYVETPEFVVPGRPKFYATAVTLCGYALPALGETQAGRPVKLEGNAEHPASRGVSDPFLQAALLGLYDPDRSQAPRRDGVPVAWDRVDAALAGQAAALDRDGGAGFRILTGATTSPTLQRQVQSLLRRWPNANWHVFEPLADEASAIATEATFGRPLEQHLLLERAELLVCLDDDPLGPGPRQALHGSRWAARRRAYQSGDGGCAVRVAEPTPSLTGVIAEDRLIVPRRLIAPLARAIAARLGLGAGLGSLDESQEAWAAAAADALAQHRGRCLLTIGSEHGSELQALALRINLALAADGATLGFSEPLAVAPPDGFRSFERLIGEMRQGAVTRIAILDANPAYAAPGDLDFAAALAQVPLRWHAGLHYDETAALCDWHLPLAHELEAWSDARATDGTVTIVQPLIRPLYATRALHALLEGFHGRSAPDSREAVQEVWRDLWGDGFEARWRDALTRGFVPGSAPPFVSPRPLEDAPPPLVAEGGEGGGMSLVFRADPTVWDGRFAGNAWLQETPKPLTKITWGNAILISPALSRTLGLENGDEVRLELDGRTLSGPVWILPGQEADTLVATFGYGRRVPDHLAAGLGYDAFAVRHSSRSWHANVRGILPTGHRQVIATTQMHQAMDGYDFVRSVEARSLPPASEPAAPPTFYPEPQRGDPAWGMSIDLDLCIGCNACVVACVAENNVPMVGPELVAQGREMHWLRVDRYYEGDPDAPKSYFQPVPCMHCEQAPCEMGCPVNATVHSSDGLNLQVYNRCIGTRTCSSYCPYKVRRFNWFDYTGDDPEQMRALRNPDVTVRSRGVMEKCTYCIQRISEARIAAKIDGRALRDGDVVTACQQACPTQAIVFGNIADPDAEVSRRKAGARDYSLLEEVNTRPRTTYLARIEPGSADEEAEG